MSKLTEAEIRVLNEALDDEYRSWATYDQVISDFGDMPPFREGLNKSWMMRAGSESWRESRRRAA